MKFIAFLYINDLFVILFFFLLLCPKLQAYQIQEQNNNTQCSQLYEESKSLYKNGLFQESIENIEACSQLKTLDFQIKVKILKLLVLNYIYIDNFDRARIYMKIFLNNNPEYKLASQDPIEFRRLYLEFRTYPIFGLSIFYNLSYTSSVLLSSYAIGNDINEPNYSGSLNGLGGGLAFYLWLSKGKSSLNFEPHYNQRGFSVSQDIFNFNEQTGFSTLVYRSNFQTLDLPLLWNYYFNPFKAGTKYSKLNFTAGLGGGVYFLISSSLLDVQRTFLDNTVSSLNLRNFDNLMQRKSWNYEGIVRLGINYKLKKSYLQFIINYKFGLNNVVRPNRRYFRADELQDLLYVYGHVDDDFLLNQFQISFRYTYLFYNPKLKKVK